MRRVYTIIAVALVGLGLAVRLVETLSGNYVFGFDQGLDVLAASRIAFNHKLTLIGSEAGAGFAGLPGIFHGPGYHYILAVLLAISSGNPFGAIVFLAVLGVCTVYVLYRLSKTIFGPQVAGIAAVLIAVSPPLSAQARMIWAPNFSGILAIPFLYALWLSGKKTKLAVFATTLFAASLYHFELPMAVPAIVAVLLYFAFVLKIRGAAVWAAAIGGVVIGFLPMIAFEARHGWTVIHGLLSYGARQTAGAGGSAFAPFRELTGDVNAIMTTIRESFPMTIPLVTHVIAWVLPFASLYYASKEKHKAVRQYLYALLLLMASHLIVFYPYRGPVYPHYLTLLYFIYPLLAAYVAVRLAAERSARFIVYGLLVLFVTAIVTRIPKTIAYDYRDYGGTAKIRGKMDAIDAIYEHAAGAGFNLLVFSPPVYTYPYDYIISWYAKKRYGYAPGSKLSGSVYLLIEPDPEKPWSYTGWLETVIQKGDIMASWKLPSGFIIQKRFILQGAE